jgi:mono/diheme cytochrome c family protein
MKLSRLWVILLGLAALMWSTAWATAQWMKLFGDVYKPKASTALSRARCAVCHVELDGSGGLNSYGKMLEGKPLARKSLRAIQNYDADKDKFSNIVEIRAGTLPGNAKSKPRAGR